MKARWRCIVFLLSFLGFVAYFLNSTYPLLFNSEQTWNPTNFTPDLPSLPSPNPSHLLPHQPVVDLWGKLRPVEYNPPALVRLLHDDASVALGRNLSFYVHCVTWVHRAFSHYRGTLLYFSFFSFLDVF
jgi:hypothetical protein